MLEVKDHDDTEMCLIMMVIPHILKPLKTIQQFVTYVVKDSGWTNLWERSKNLVHYLCSETFTIKPLSRPELF